MLSRYVVVVALLLGACQTTAPTLNSGAAEQRQALQSLDAFSVTGGLGVWTAEESISTRIEWQQSEQDFDVLVRLPAGLNTVQVTQQNGVAMVRQGSADPVTGSSASRLLQQALGLGVAVPIEQMALWIKGVPGQQAEKVNYDKQGRLASMEYVDTQNTRWRAKVLKYTTFENTFVPATILATGGPYTVRLVLKKWSKELKSVDADASSGKSKGRLKVPGR